MTTMAPQKRPLILLHKCTECATFALAPMPIVEEKNMEIDRIRLRFSQVLMLNNVKSTSVVPETNLDEADDDSAYGSNSGQSSPDESPMSRSDSPTAVGHEQPRSIENDAIVSATRPQNPFRCRSMSESGNSQLKGILKRRPMTMRSLSQCDEENSSGYDPNRRNSESPTLSSIHSSNEDGLDRNVSESGDDDDGQLRDRSQSTASSTSKKMVRFNDHVQENVFRPNSSILGQRKKNQRKQERKRKRTNSGDSQTGGSENENETDHDRDYEVDNSQEIDRRDLEIDTEEPQSVEAPAIDAAPEELAETVHSVSEKPVVIQTSPEKHVSKAISNRKKSQRRSPAILDDKRYNGFVLGTEKKPRSSNHRRHSSGDSGLGDDEEEAEVFTSPLPEGGKNRRRRVVSCGDAKDSGIEE